MANWRNLAMTLILADGQIDDTEVKILKKELFADKKIDKEEAEFLVELRNKAQKKAKETGINPAFEKLFFTALETHILEDGVIDADETALSGESDLRGQESGRQREEIPRQAQKNCDADLSRVRGALRKVHGQEEWGVRSEE